MQRGIPRSCIVLIALLFPVILSRVLSTVPRVSMNESNDLWKSLIRGLSSPPVGQEWVCRICGRASGACAGTGWAFGKFQQYLQSLTEAEWKYRKVNGLRCHSAIVQRYRRQNSRDNVEDSNDAAKHSTQRCELSSSTPPLPRAKNRWILS